MTGTPDRSTFIDRMDDPRIAVFRNLKDKELAAKGDLFVAEGESLVRRLLQSPFPVHSMLVTQRRADDLAAIAPSAVPFYVAPEKLIHEIIGFKFHSGVIACGRRLPSPTLEQALAQPGQGRAATLVIVPEVNNLENLGSLIRVSAAFGATAMVLGEHCADPFWRRSIRVSMGTVFALPIVRSESLVRDLARLKDQWGMELIATVCDDQAEPLDEARQPERVGLLFGQEGPGLGAKFTLMCDRRVTIPMRLGTDSLNVAVAAAVFLFHFTRSRSQGRDMINPGERS